MSPPLSEQEFEALVRETHSRIRAYVAGLGVASADVDDVAQEVYLEFYKGRDRIPDEVDPQRWLKGIARNVALNFIRRTTRRGRLHREAICRMLGEESTERAASIADGPEADALEDCLAKLPSRSRNLIRWRYGDELPSQTIAQRLGATAEAIRVALFRIRAGLRQCVARSLGTDSADVLGAGSEG